MLVHEGLGVGSWWSVHDDSDDQGDALTGGGDAVFFLLRLSSIL